MTSQATTRLAWLATARRVIGATAATTFAGAWYYRPVADQSIDGTGPRRDQELFCSESNPYIRAHTPPILEAARTLSIGFTTIVIRLFINTYGSFEIVDDDNYKAFVGAVLGEGRENPSRGLITVSNHRSLFDDPGVMSGLGPEPHFSET